MKIKLTAEYFPDVPSFLISSAPRQVLHGSQNRFVRRGF
jgi:hypothetical protein